MDTPRSNSPAGLDDLAATDDTVAPFQIEKQPVRGRVVRMGPALDQILTAHDYPEPVARLLGEAVLITVLIGASLKFDGRLILQASGDGPVSFLVADYATSGAIRAYVKLDPERVDAAIEAAQEGLGALLGEGTMAMTIDQGPDMDRYQGVVPLEGETIAEAAEAYFAQSEQIPTRIKAAIGRWQGEGEAMHWRGGAMMIQQIAADDTRGDAGEAWNTARALFDTLADDELVDPELSGGRVLFRLFHEDGVRLMDSQGIRFECRCSRDSVRNLLSSFSEEEIGEMVENGAVSATCEYCNTQYAFDAAELAPGQPRQ